MDIMVLEVQQWLNKTYGQDSRFKRVDEDGNTGWPTIYGLTRALQIELGISATADNFGSGTQAKFQSRWPNGIQQQKDGDQTTSNVYSIIQGALWCKGYSTGSRITQNFYGGTGNAIRTLKMDMGFGDGSTVDLEVMKSLLSMKQFVLLSQYGGKQSIRNVQQQINLEYRSYTGIIPTDGLYGREMNTALIQVLQSIEGFSVSEATGYFGNGTKSRLLTINGFNANTNERWLWIATVVLLCNGYGEVPKITWDYAILNDVKRFQSDYGIPVTGQFDTTTWMSLFVSNGDPNRLSIACDTRFEITNELLNKLKADGYQIVGRYLTGGDFKEIRNGELERIVKGGLKYFPIFQENARDLSDFSYEQGKEHGKKAVKAALEKGIPFTVIYFAVDMDIMDYQVDSYIIPYFRGVNDGVGLIYDVGIYASRNTCTKVAQAGLSVSSFVSDMSTGFSGNLGFPIPKNWNYDQFHEIKGYGGEWDLDKVAYSGRIKPCDTVNYSSTSTAPIIPDVSSLQYSIFDAINLVGRLENAYVTFKKVFQQYPHPYNYSPKNVAEGVLNYLSKPYSQLYSFSLSVQPYDVTFANYLAETNSDLVHDLQALISQDREEVKDSIGGKIDVAHWALSTLAYVAPNLAPDFWAGWGGDLATGMRTLHSYMQKYPELDTNLAAMSIIGADTSAPSDYFVKYHVDMVQLGNECNFTDLCDDADAIALSRLILQAPSDTDILSKSMKNYYQSLSTQSRYKQYQYDDLDLTSITKTYESVWRKMTGLFESVNIPYASDFVNLKGESTEVEQKAVCKAFANYLHSKI